MFWDHRGKKKRIFKWNTLPIKMFWDHRGKKTIFKWNTLPNKMFWDYREKKKKVFSNGTPYQSKCFGTTVEKKKDFQMEHLTNQNVLGPPWKKKDFQMEHLTKQNVLGPPWKKKKKKDFQRCNFLHPLGAKTDREQCLVTCIQRPDTNIHMVARLTSLQG
jgi:hypothetical protein